MDIKDAKYIAWVDRGYGNWSAQGFETLKEAIGCETYGSEKMITYGAIDWEPVVQED